MSSFAPSAAPLAGRDAVRRRAFAAFEAQGLPTTVDEVWRYAPLSDFDLSRYAVASSGSAVAPSAFALSLAAHTVGHLVLDNGFVASTTALPAGVTVETHDTPLGVTDADPVVTYGGDTFALLNVALNPTTVIVKVAAGTVLDAPLLVTYLASSGASFPRVLFEVGERARAHVVEYFEGGDNGLVVPLSEYRVAASARLDLVTYQRLALTAWHVARTTGYVARDGRLSQSVVGFGGAYDRSRNDAVLLESGAHNELRTTFLGTGDQVHDFRTRQFHVAGRTSSALLSKGAVADRARSIYTGLIEIEKGARRTDARQTNHNLLLSPHAHADSVPNLDIRENDVVCAHASSVGPLDELQRWYLESRGVPQIEAERLMIQGFFYEMLATLPTGVAAVVEADVTSVLSHAVVTA